MPDRPHSSTSTQPAEVQPKPRRRVAGALLFGLLALLIAAGCSSEDGPELGTLPESESDNTPAVAADPEPELVAAGPEAIEVSVISRPDGRLLNEAEQTAANAYIDYYSLLDTGNVDQAQAEAIASGSALDALLFAAGVGVEVDGSTTTVGILDAEATGSTIVLTTCEVADLGENSLLDLSLIHI